MGVSATQSPFSGSGGTIFGSARVCRIMTCVRLRALVIDFLVGFLDSCSDGLWLELSMNLCNIIITAADNHNNNNRYGVHSFTYVGVHVHG
jgi:hypothetical protein